MAATKVTIEGTVNTKNASDTKYEERESLRDQIKALLKDLSDEQYKLLLTQIVTKATKADIRSMVNSYFDTWEDKNEILKEKAAMLSEFATPEDDDETEDDTNYDFSKLSDNDLKEKLGKK